MVKLAVENITKSFGDEVALRGISFTIEEGVFKTILGPSGCGKSTTLRCIAGLETPDSGVIKIDGETVSRDGRNLVATRDRDVGLVFQSYAIWPHMTVEENVKFPLDYDKSLTGEERTRMAREVIELVGLGGREDDLATNLSGGQQQRVALARSLVAEPDILLMDEPLSNLDQKLREEMREEIYQITRELETTVLYVTHAQEEAMFLSDEILLMRDGEIVEEGPPSDLYKQPRTPFGMDFMGDSNSFAGRVVGTGSSTRFETSVGVFETDHADFESGEEVVLSLRPEDCHTIARDDRGDDLPDANVFEGTVTIRSSLGERAIFHVDLGGAEMVSYTMSPDPQIAEGDEVYVEVQRDAVNVYATGEELLVQ